MINNKKIKQSVAKSLGILAILVLGVMIIPAKTNAQYSYSGYTNVIPYDRTGGFNNNQYYYQNTYQAPVYAQPQTQAQPVAPTPTIYSDSTNPNAATSAPKTVAKAKTTTKKDAETSSGLAANAIFGSNGFMPSGAIQWILFAILVLVMVILVRKVFGGERAYHSIPMKHS